MPLAQLTVVPLDSGQTSLSATVAAVQKALRATGIKHQLTPMSTILEGTLDEIFAAIRAMHEAGFSHGSMRVSTTITLDDRRDKPTSMEYKVESVRKKLGD